MAEFFLEVRCEEIPAKMLERGIGQLGTRLFEFRTRHVVKRQFEDSFGAHLADHLGNRHFAAAKTFCQSSNVRAAKMLLVNQFSNLPCLMRTEKTEDR